MLVFQVFCVGFRVWDLEFRVQDLRFRVHDYIVGFRIEG